MTPIEIGERFHLGAAVLGAVALAAGAWEYLPPLPATPASALALGIVAVVVLSIVTLAVLDARRAG